MKKNFLIIIGLILCVLDSYSQFRVYADGSVQFKVNNVLAGFTGNQEQGNVSFGYASLLNQSAGTYNTAIGSSALYSNITTANYNTAIGSSALYFNTSGSSNTANGVCALYSNTTGGYNTADGHLALIGNTTGYYNTADGYLALYSNTTGSYNTAIGYYAGGNNPNNLTNSTAIGYAATATASNQVRIGDYDVTEIGGYVAWSNFSDGRAKKNIRTDVPGLAFINGLQPITYNLDLDAIDGLLKIDGTKRVGEEELSQELKDIEKKARKAKEKVIQTGFIAQDVEKTAKSIGYDFSGVNVDETGIYGLRYAEFVVPLVKAVQELSEQNEQLQAQINELQKKDALRSAESVTGLQELTNSGASLQQNFPNPFSETTQIKCYLPQSIKTAFLNIYNLQGKQLRQIAVTQRGESSLLIAGSEFEQGIYLYALIADGREVDVKRMILTE
ncbi:MAG: tail fiber domain-containing protein [Dysgonamonadaceae bacterium]|nr:tail fiber domain-containing protein [Dysgonamonadaceae bacterium]